ncbi:hypothetical protein [Oryza sativa Japonica Group]|uniref:Uncharacterized protein n=1 Tax=Oryza sativa subsp. japonica TaxID=39947 RepID=Q5JJW5_ORYSJ|nr:hypothetical protein [Oryza sativa Japonica Group]BAD88242.1 hypothetical protein [Oryza sativa Japonica Group]
MAVAVAAGTAAVSCPRLVPERIPLSASVAVTCGRGCGVAVRAHGQSATRRGEKLCDDHDGHGGCQCGGWSQQRRGAATREGVVEWSSQKEVVRARSSPAAAPPLLRPAGPRPPARPRLAAEVLSRSSASPRARRPPPREHPR